jgi:mRNA interferase MazF
VLCPIKTRVKNYPLEVPVPDGGKIADVVLADQVKSLSWEKRNADFAEAAPRHCSPVCASL